MASVKWIKNDAQNRAWRTVLQGIVATIVIPAADAALQVLARALTDGGAISWGQVAMSAALAALTAIVMASTAYLHRAYIDPSPIPSALPPRPPGVSASEAPLTVPAKKSPRT